MRDLGILGGRLSFNILIASHVLMSFPPHAAAKTGEEEIETRVGVGDQSAT